MSLGYVWLSYIYMYGQTVAAGVLLVLAIVILCMKDSYTKVLGLAFLAGALNVLLSFSINPILARSFSATDSKRIVVMSYICTIAGLLFEVFLMLYAKIRYNSKGLLSVIGLRVLCHVIIYFYNSHRLSAVMGLSPDKARVKTIQYEYSLRTITAVFSIAVIAIIYDAYKKNRDFDNLLPKIYMFPMLSMLIQFVLCAFYVYGIFVVPTAKGSDTNQSIDVICTFILIVKYVMYCVFAAYIIKREKEVL